VPHPLRSFIAQRVGLHKPQSNIVIPSERGESKDLLLFFLPVILAGNLFLASVSASYPIVR